MDTRKPNIVWHGPVAEHDLPCPVYYNEHPAVLDINRGVFRPSWYAQERGWQLVCANTWWKRLLLRLLHG